MTTQPRPSAPDLPSRRPVLVVMGVSGVGKSTVAALLSERLGWDFAEGDTMHPTENVEKMAAGHPLDDADRGPWLEIVSAWIRQHTDEGAPGIITCSALRKSYRDVLRGPDVVFVHLAGPTDLIGARLSKRLDHFMPAGLLDSQVATLEPLEADERHVVVDAGRAPEIEVDEILSRLDLAPGVG